MADLSPSPALAPRLVASLPLSQHLAGLAWLQPAAAADTPQLVAACAQLTGDRWAGQLLRCSTAGVIAGHALDSGAACVATGPAGVAVAGLDDGRLVVWPGTGGAVTYIAAHQKAIGGVAWQPPATGLLSCGYDGRYLLRLCEVATEHNTYLSQGAAVGRRCREADPCV